MIVLTLNKKFSIEEIDLAKWHTIAEAYYYSYLLQIPSYYNIYQHSEVRLR